jgi:hypothetical protein
MMAMSKSTSFARLHDGAPASLPRCPWGSPKFPHTSSDPADGDPGGSRDGCDATMVNRACFGGGQQAAFTIIQMRRQQHETFADWSEIDQLRPRRFPGILPCHAR